MSAIYPYIEWTSGRNIDASFAIRIALILWLTIILARGMRLLQYMASFDIDLARYAERDLDSIEISFKYKFSAWKTYLKEPIRKARPFYIIFFLIYLLHIFLKFSEVVYFVVANLFLFAFITIVILSAADEISKYIANFHSKYKATESGQSKTEIATCLKRGFLTGAAFTFCLILLINMPKYHYFFYFLAFSLLYSFSTILIHQYKAFSAAIYDVLGHNFDQIPLKTGFLNY